MARSQTHVSNYMNAFFNHLPDEQKKRALIDRKIKRVHAQFAACVDGFILEHVNSVYLTKEEIPESKDVSRETQQILTVYVDNSLVAAELNAQRELVILKYREQFDVKVNRFDIKISRGAYRENYPFKKPQYKKNFPTPHKLTTEEEKEIETRVSHIKDKDIRESFQRVLKATKEHLIKN